MQWNLNQNTSAKVKLRYEAMNLDKPRVKWIRNINYLTLIFYQTLHISSIHYIISLLERHLFSSADSSRGCPMERILAKTSISGRYPNCCTLFKDNRQKTIKASYISANAQENPLYIFRTYIGIIRYIYTKFKGHRYFSA